MNLQTQIPLKTQNNNQIDYNSRIVLLGSCFSENIGAKFNYYKFQNIINPFGVLFHPKAIEALVLNAIENKKYVDGDVFFHNEQWHCYKAHSKLSNTSKTALLQELNTAINLTQSQIKQASHIVITLGTAWVYKHKKTNKIVANCHKVPQNEFQKKLLKTPIIVESLKNTVSKIREINTKTSIIFTISPVRHLKDGFIENTQSKSHLIAAVHKFLSQEKLTLKNQLYYFPSYEIMFDELRDYRFYKPDMLHPNEVAINYIWQKFKTVWVNAETEKIIKEVESIQKALLHKPFNKNTEAYKKFSTKFEHKKEDLQRKFVHIKF